ncbi:MAG: hypothetical protein MJ189_02335 [Coriobacteriales bacterium]|nr:hypothetical protein [Coriobacteriales bacterium]
MSKFSKFVLYACFSGLLIAVGAIAVFPVVAFAYVDPSVMTYTIQALAGVAVALSAVLSVAFRRSRRAIMKLLGIDENQKKDVDPSVTRQKTSLARPYKLLKSQGTSNRRGGHHIVKKKSAGFFKRLIFAILASLAATCTILVVPIVETIKGSEADLAFNFATLWPPIFQVAIIVAAVIFIVLLIMWGRVFDVLFALVTSAAFCVWLQIMFLNGDMPSANGTALDMSLYQSRIIIGIIVWALVVIAMLVLMIWKRKIGRGVCTLLCIGLLITQGAALVGIYSSANEDAKMNTELIDSSNIKGDVTLTDDGLNTLSTKKNVIVFVLDTMDNTIVDEIENRYSDLYDGFEGFTRYDNNTGAFIPTRHALPYLTTGSWLKDDETGDDYIETRYQRSTFLRDIYDQGYSVGVYTDTMYEGKELWKDFIMNLRTDFEIRLNEDGIVDSFLKTAAFKDLPWAFKENFWFNTDEINNSLMIKDQQNTSNVYTMGDYQYWTDLKETKRLQASDTSGENGAFRFIHIMGAHEPFDMDAKMNYLGDQIYNGSYTDAKSYATFKIVKEYLDQLRTLGLYNNASIILTADHGFYSNRGESLNYTESPFLMVKQAGQFEGKVKHSKIQTSHKDLFPQIIKMVGGQYAQYGTPIDEVAEGKRDRYCFTTCGDVPDTAYIECKVSGEATSLSAWSHTGRRWDIKKEKNQR